MSVKTEKQQFFFQVVDEVRVRQFGVLSGLLQTVFLQSDLKNHSSVRYGVTPAFALLRTG